MRLRLASCLGLALFQACARPAAPSAAPTDAGVASAPVFAPTKGPPHGGLLGTTSDGHLELLLSRAGAAQVWLLGADLSPVSPAGLEGTLTLAIPGYDDVPLAARGDHLFGQGKPVVRDAFAALVSVRGPQGSRAARVAVNFKDPSRGPPSEVTVRPRGASIIGRVMDTPCLLKGEQPTPEHAECAQRCILRGAPMAIVEEGTGQVFVALPGEGKSLKELLLPYVGQRLELFGTPSRAGGSQFFVVDAAVAEHEHSSHAGGQVGMIGDLHLEVLLLRSGEVRVYLSDAFRRPVSALGRRGTVDVRVGDAEPASAPLEPAEQGAYLAARTAPASTEVEVTVHLPVPEDPGYLITFVLEPLEAPAAEPAPAAPSQPGPAAAPVAKVAPTDELKVRVEGDYQPKLLKLKKGVPARLRFFRANTSECTREVVFPDFGVRAELAPMAETVVELTPDRAGTFEFTCGMGMLRGKLVVE